MLKYELYFSQPLMNAAGSLSFAPDARLPIDLSKFGAFITNPISLAPRAPAQSRCYLPFPGGFLLHSGYPNPGLKNVIRRYAPRWAQSPLPVIVHLLAQEMRELAAMVERLESQEGVMAVEVSIPLAASEDLTFALVSAAVGELPLIARLPVACAADLAEAAIDAGANALSLSPPRGVLSNAEGRLISGRLFGPSLLPHTMLALQALEGCDVPVIAGGGIYHAEQVQAALDAGAAAVQLDSVLWQREWL
jgi:dihydroorotate dehydrogenase (NAD+) catalytic subunit